MTGNGEKKFSRGLLSCRQVLFMLTMLGFMLNYALRVNLTIALVAMVKNTKAVKNHVANDSLITNGFNSSDQSIENFSTVGYNSTSYVGGGGGDGDGGGGIISNDRQPDHDIQGEYEWDEVQQNMLLGCFFWGYILTELPGGRLAELIGGVRVFGHSMLWASLFTLLIPLAAAWDYIALLVIRVFLGFLLGASWPSIHPIAAVWIPPMERSKYIANMMASALGAAVTMPISGVLISWIGWPSVFYFTGGLGVLWSVAWFTLIYETPAVHPRITPEERQEIEEAIGTTTSRKRPSYVPWRQLLTSGPVWAVVITHACSVFGYFTVINQLPTYMRHILKYSIKENGLLSSLPYLGKYIMAVAASFLADHLRKTKKLTTTQTRKLFTFFPLLLPGLVMIVQVFMGHNRAWSVSIFTVALTINGAVTGGYLSNGLDIAPNFSGTIFGMANSLSSCGGFFSTYLIGALTYKNQVYEQWVVLFWVLAAAYLIGSVFYVIFGSGELQPWNTPPEKIKPGQEDAFEEGIPLKEKSISPQP